MCSLDLTSMQFTGWEVQWCLQMVVGILVDAHLLDYRRVPLGFVGSFYILQASLFHYVLTVFIPTPSPSNSFSKSQVGIILLLIMQSPLVLKFLLYHFCSSNRSPGAATYVCLCLLVAFKCQDSVYTLEKT